MGVAEVIPGVSAGTIAFITGIHDELLHSLRAVDREAVQLLRRYRFGDFWKKINGSFLVAVFGGIITSFLSLARLMVYLLRQQPILVWSFFFGVILISAPLILREIRHWNLAIVIGFLLGAGIAYLVTILSPTQTPEGIWFVFFAGMLTISSMVIPGISGVFVLLLISKYQYMVNALIHHNILVIAVFLAGCIVGLLSFSRFLRWILDNYRSTTVALLAGIMLGSLNKVWPWRQVLEYVTNSKGEQVPAFDKSILPWHYFATTGKDPQVFQAILMIALGVFIVVLIEKIALRLKTKI